MGGSRVWDFRQKNVLTNTDGGLGSFCLKYFNNWTKSIQGLVSYAPLSHHRCSLFSGVMEMKLFEGNVMEMEAATRVPPAACRTTRPTHGVKLDHGGNCSGLVFIQPTGGGAQEINATLDPVWLLYGCMWCFKRLKPHENKNTNLF